MTVYELCDLFIDPAFQEIEIWDINTEKTVYKGEADEIPDNLNELEIQSIDNINKDGILSINVDTTE